MLYRSFIEPGAIGRCPIGGYCLLSLDQIPPGVAGSGPAGASAAAPGAPPRRRPTARVVGGRSVSSRTRTYLFQEAAPRVEKRSGKE